MKDHLLNRIDTEAGEGICGTAVPYALADDLGDEIRRLRALLAAQGWKPIDTAPVDQEVIVWYEGDCVPAVQEYDGVWWALRDKGDYENGAPMHGAPELWWDFGNGETMPPAPQAA